jgi:hypothetical protein
LNSFNQILKIGSFVIIGLFIALGIFILTSDYFSGMPLNYRIIFGIFVIAYGAFRLATVLSKAKYEKDNE